MLPLGLSARLLLALFIVTAHAPAAFGQAGGPYDLRRSTIDGGGGISASGGTYRVAATIGQPDTGAASGGSYFLAGGFWGGINAIESTPTPTVTDTVPSTPTTTASPSPTQTATAVLTAPASSTPSSSPTASGSPSATSTAPTASPTPSATPSPTGTPPACAGDCDQSGTVTVAELIRGINIALGTAPGDSCTSIFDGSGDGVVTVDELITAVDRALHDCAGGVARAHL